MSVKLGLCPDLDVLHMLPMHVNDAAIRGIQHVRVCRHDTVLTTATV